MDQDIEKKLNEFIADIDELKTSMNVGQNKMWANQLREFLSKLKIAQSDIDDVYLLLDNIIKKFAFKIHYDQLKMFLRVLLRKDLSYLPKGVIRSSTINIVTPKDFEPTYQNTTKETSSDVVANSGLSPSQLKKIFVVHGHDDKSKLELARILEKMGLEIIILHEQPNQGRTIIEKFEKYSEGVNFAFILLTPDDLGGKDKDHLKERARQNVILELGFFMGRFGRSRVCCLHKSEIEIPTDYLGVTFLPFTNSPKECYGEIIRELRAAGYNLKI